MQRMANPKEDARSADRSAIEERITRNLNLFVEQSKYTQNQIADMSGIPQATLGRYIRGDSAAIPSEALAVLAQVFGRNVGDFYERNPPPPPKDLSNAAPVFLRSRPGVDLTDEDFQDFEALLERVKERRARKLASATSPKKKPEK
jgi:transcriptional regulator with XRE-family HTH domain